MKLSNTFITIGLLFCNLKYSSSSPAAKWDGYLAQNLPEEKQVKKGDAITLDCQHPVYKFYCVWTTPLLTKISNRDAPLEDYVLSFNKDTGICTMLVVSVDNKDNGRWSCLLGGVGLKYYDLVVLVPPLENYFIYENERLDDDITDLTTEKFKLSCVAKDSKPEATIKWKIDNGELFDGTIESNPTSGDLFTVTSTIEVKLPTPDSRFYYSSGLENYKHEKRVECIIEHPALAEPTILKKYIARKYATQEVSIEHDGEGGIVTMKIGEGAKFFCKADGNPQPDERNGYEFYKLENYGLRLLHTGQNFTVFDEGDYQCEAANELVSGEKVSSEPVTVKFESWEICNSDQQTKCRTDVSGNKCILTTNGMPKCECNDATFEAGAGDECKPIFNCTEEEEWLCKTHMFGNKCETDGYNSKCQCDNIDCELDSSGKKCLFRVCDDVQNNMCATWAGLNLCEIRNGKHVCFCREPSFESLGTDECIKKHCNIEEKRDCREDVDGNSCISDTNREPRCNCENPDYQNDGPYRCQQIKYSCDASQYYACNAHIYGNTCNVTTDGETICTCGNPDYENDGSSNCIPKHCTIEEKRDCRHDVDGNSCILDTNREPRCNCENPDYQNDGPYRCQQIKLSCDASQYHACNAHIDGNLCSITTNRETTCTCGNPDYENDGPRKCVLSIKECNMAQKYDCQVDHGNQCDVTDNGKVICRCDNPYYGNSGYDKCILKWCNSTEESKCQKPGNAGNKCTIKNDHPKCECGHVDFEVGSAEDECLQRICDAEQRKKCRIDIFGNLCNLHNRTAKCRCNDINFEIGNSDECVPLSPKTCNSDQEKKCRTDASGNKCNLTNGVPKCECNDATFEAGAADECKLKPISGKIKEELTVWMNIFTLHVKKTKYE